MPTISKKKQPINPPDFASVLKVCLSCVEELQACARGFASGTKSEKTGYLEQARVAYAELGKRWTEAIAKEGGQGWSRLVAWQRINTVANASREATLGDDGFDTIWLRLYPELLRLEPTASFDDLKDEVSRKMKRLLGLDDAPVTDLPQAADPNTPIAVKPAKQPAGEQIDPVSQATAFLLVCIKRHGCRPTMQEVLQAVPTARRSTLYRDGQFRAAWKAAGVSVSIPKGTKSRGGDIDAYGEDGEIDIDD